MQKCGSHTKRSAHGAKSLWDSQLCRSPWGADALRRDCPLHKVHWEWQQPHRSLRPEQGRFREGHPAAPSWQLMPDTRLLRNPTRTSPALGAL